MTEINRQPPGVKGQWIKVSECPPPESENCERRTELNANSDNEQYWRPNYICDSRPLTLPETSVSSEAAPSKPRLAAGQVWFDRAGRKCTISKNTYDKNSTTDYPFQSNFVERVGYCGLTADGISCFGKDHDATLVELISEQNVSSKSVERKIEELLFSDSGMVFAKGEDKTLWCLSERPYPEGATTELFWIQIPPLPTR
jgi:hypothetical protein